MAYNEYQRQETRPHLYEETPEERYRRLKAISDATGKRLLFVYREEERRRLLKKLEERR